MTTRTRIVITALSVTAGLLACSKPEPAPIEQQAPSQEQLEREQEAAQRAEEAAALETRLSNAADPLLQLSKAVESGQLPQGLAASIGELNASLEAPRQLVADLGDAQGDAWESARDRLQTRLDDLERQSAAVQQTLADWRERERQALEAREQEGLPIDAETGLIEGLDGGEYEQYLVSVVERVQSTLRSAGLYAGPADGTFDGPTRAAIGRFQERENLAASGVPSPMTRERLFGE